MNSFDNFGLQFTGRHSPNWLLEMLSHPFLLIVCIMVIGLGYMQVSRKIKDGEIKIDSKIGSIIVIVGVLAMMFIANR